MRIALISDVHANLVALEAIFEDISLQGVDQIFCLGDLVGAGPDPSAVVDRLTALEIPVLMGNWDDAVATNRPFKNEEYVRLHMDYTRAELNAKHLKYLQHLPHHWSGQWEGVKVSLYHAHPDNLMTKVMPDSRIEGVKGMFRDGEDLVAFGHIHHPFIRWESGRCLVSVGYCSLHMDGDSRAAYTLVDIQTKGIVQVAQRRVHYDREKVIQQARRKGLPVLEGFIQLLQMQETNANKDVMDCLHRDVNKFSN